MPIFNFRCPAKFCGDECERLIINEKRDWPYCHCGSKMKKAPAAPSITRVNGFNEKNGYGVREKKKFDFGF